MTCDVADTVAAERQVERVAAGLKLISAYEGGIPVQAGRPALRPVKITALWVDGAGNDVPWVGLPLLFEAPEGLLFSDSAVTDNQGQATVQLSGRPPTDAEIQVRVNAIELLGKVSTLWPSVSTHLRLRQVTPQSGRVAVAIAEAIASEAINERVTETAVVARLTALDFRGAVQLPDDWLQRLVEAAPKARKEILNRLADAMGGKVDQVVLGDARSDYASRMGARSVWHEAAGTAVVFDVWTGTEIGRVEQTARAAGIGDFNAGRKALKQLGLAMGDAVAALLGKQTEVGAQSSVRTAHAP